MATNSFDGISNCDWPSVAAYQNLQSVIQAEVAQGLWANQLHVDGWCFILASPPQGVNNSWVTYTYRGISDNTQTTTVIWPVGWPAPAEDINGQLPSHFFTDIMISSATTTSDTVGVNSIGLLYETYAAPASQPSYKPAGDCV
ncbi:MAG: hypothetical protein ACRDHZ_18860 [Ktedonobacteraceae bacterium]